MTDNRQPKLSATVVKLYRTHWGLFWCIMLPVAVIAIGWNVAQSFRLGSLLEEDISNMTPSYPNGHVSTVVSSISTADGIQSTVASSDTDLPANTRSSFREVWEIEDNFATIMFKRKWMSKDILCAHAPSKVVAFPIRTVSRQMPFHNAVVIGNTGIVETRTPDALTSGVADILYNIDFKSRF